MKPTQKLHEPVQSLWVDSITRRLLISGELKGYIEGAHDAARTAAGAKDLFEHAGLSNVLIRIQGTKEG